MRRAAAEAECVESGHAEKVKLLQKGLEAARAEQQEQVRPLSLTTEMLCLSCDTHRQVPGALAARSRGLSRVRHSVTKTFDQEKHAAVGARLAHNVQQAQVRTLQREKERAAADADAAAAKQRAAEADRAAAVAQLQHVRTLTG